MPDQLILGQSARLGCDFDLEQSRLYSVNWYKDGKEFFRFMPSMENKVQVFPVEGVNVDVRYSCLDLRVKALSCLVFPEAGQQLQPREAVPGSAGQRGGLQV